jgi:hypothetical protein
MVVDHARLAHHLVGAGFEVDGHRCSGAGADVLDFVDDLSERAGLLAVEVHLGDVVAGVGDAEGDLAAG